MKGWEYLGLEKVLLTYEDGTVIVSRKDFNRAFGAMVNSTREEVERDFGCKQ